MNTASVLIYALTCCKLFYFASCICRYQMILNTCLCDELFKLCSINIISLCLFLGVSGYVASSMYKKIGGINWAWNIVLTATLFAGSNCQYLIHILVKLHYFSIVLIVYLIYFKFCNGGSNYVLFTIECLLLYNI